MLLRKGKHDNCGNSIYCRQPENGKILTNLGT